MSLRTLTGIEMGWAKAALSAMFPRAGALSVGLGDLDVETFLRAAFLRIPLEPALVLRVAIWMLALAPFWVLGRPRTLSALSTSEQAKVVTQLASSRAYVVRQLVLALKAVGAMFYAADPAVRSVMMPPRSAPIPLRSREDRAPEGGARDRRSAA